MSSLTMLIKSAQSSHARGDYAAAVRSYEGILARDPRNYDVAYLMAVALYQAGRLERALAAFAAAAKLNPRRFEPHKDRGLILMKLGQHEEAAQSFASALKLSPRSPELLLNRGLALKNAGRTEEAIQSYRAAIRLKPDLAEAHNNLGNALAMLGQSEEALEAYSTAYRLKPLYAEAQVNAARLLLELYRFTQARDVLDSCIARTPGHAEAHRSLAECLHVLGNDEAALAAASRAIALAPRQAAAFLTRAGLLESLRRDGEALDDYSRAQELEPANVPALLARARLLCRQSRFEEALRACDLAIAAEPGNARAYYRAGRAFEGCRDFGAALASYDKAGELDPVWPEPELRRIFALSGLGRLEEALAAADAVVCSHPDLADAHLARASILRDLRRAEEALASYDRAIALVPDRAAPYGARGALRSELGEVAGALEDFGQNLRLLAGSDALLRATAEDCLKLLSVDKIPAIYDTEEELAATRQKVEGVLDELAEAYASHPPLTAVQTRISEQAMQHLAGFYLAYHQRNDRPVMQKLSCAATRLLSLSRYEPPTRPASRQSIRIGIASQRLRNHNGANWAYNWFAQLPRGDYEFFTYNFEPARDQLAAKFAALGTHRQFPSSRTDMHEVVQQMRDDALDFLMLPDVGMTPVSRFLSLHRIAPRQFTAWGHPVTTGSPEMDFYLSSDLMEPTGAADHYSEKLVRMPNLALYLEEREDEDDGEAAARSGPAFGLPEGRVLYGCLQSLFKYVPRYDDILPRIAAEVPDALFVFLEGSSSYITTVLQRRLERCFAAHGLDAGKHVLFLPRQKPSGYDRLMRAMDVCIDSVGWSGGNTTLKNIRFGVPLVTLEGEFMRGRHSSAMFRMIGAEEMIAPSTDAYVERLVRMGKDEAYRRHVADLFRHGRHRLYRDQEFIRALDLFLKANAMPH
ncbi:tetratricopeptide repeat protein [Aestuariivirga sp.]|uniref:tetratricopeptide repeat protein n=1 Tax=Aestuariivirga sp. TaxID=2650926 RepID=UPI00391D9B48